MGRMAVRLPRRICHGRPGAGAWQTQSLLPGARDPYWSSWSDSSRATSDSRMLLNLVGLRQTDTSARASGRCCSQQLHRAQSVLRMTAEGADGLAQQRDALIDQPRPLLPAVRAPAPNPAEATAAFQAERRIPLVANGFAKLLAFQGNLLGLGKIASPLVRPRHSTDHRQSFLFDNLLVTNRHGVRDSNREPCQIQYVLLSAGTLQRLIERVEKKMAAAGFIVSQIDASPTAFVTRSVRNDASGFAFRYARRLFTVSPRI